MSSIKSHLKDNLIHLNKLEMKSTFLRKWADYTKVSTFQIWIYLKFREFPMKISGRGHTSWLSIRDVVSCSIKQEVISHIPAKWRSTITKHTHATCLGPAAALLLSPLPLNKPSAPSIFSWISLSPSSATMSDPLSTTRESINLIFVFVRC